MMSVNPSSSCVNEKKPARSSGAVNMAFMSGQVHAGKSEGVMHPTQSTSSSSVTLSPDMVTISSLSERIWARVKPEASRIKRYQRQKIGSGSVAIRP
eukprot:6041445-Pleurochrysis_carterae.AAC.2